MKFAVPTASTKLSSKAITNIHEFEEIESLLPTAQELKDDEDRGTFQRKGSRRTRENLNELLEMLERDVNSSGGIGVVKN